MILDSTLHPITWVLLGASLCLSAPGCIGSIGGDGTLGAEVDPPSNNSTPVVPNENNTPIGPVDDSVCATRPQTPGAEALRMMSKGEVYNVLPQLFPNLSVDVQATWADQRVTNFVINSEGDIQPDQVKAFAAMAREVAAQAAQSPEAVMGCDATRETILLAESSGQASEEESFDITTPIKTDRLSFIGFGNNGNAWNSIFEMTFYEGNDAVGVRRAYADQMQPNLPAAHLVDGDPQSRWALEGRHVVVNFDLEREATIDRVEILWYAGDKRRAAFEFKALNSTPALANDPLACRDHFVETFGARAFRRPLDVTERVAVQELFEQGAEANGVAGGVQYVVEALMQAPSFMYAHEQVPVDAQTRAVDQFELAQRMGFVLWRALPDAQLMNAARAGELSDPETREFHARRMLQHPRAAHALRTLILEWFGLDNIASSSDSLGDAHYALSEQETPSFRESMELEVLRLVNDVIADQRSSYKPLLTTTHTFMTSQLLSHHDVEGIAEPSDGSGLHRVEVDGRAGLLTTTAFLTRNKDVIHRGLFMRSNLLCTPIGAPDATVDTTSVPPVEDESVRDWVGRRMEKQNCGGCHIMMDPLGLTLDPYDALGRARTEDQYGNVVRGTGELSGAGDVDGAVEDAGELGSRLASSPRVQSCVAQRVFAFSLGRRPSPTDSCTISKLDGALSAHDGDLREALIALIKTPTFTTLSATQGDAQ